MCRATDSTPGPGGVPYAAWRSVSDIVAPMAQSALDSLARGVEPLPCGANLSTMVFWPTVLAAGDIHTFTSDVASLRPLTLTDTLPKLLALAVNGRLAALSSITVVARQRGFVPGRSLADNLYELEAAMILFSGMRQRSAAALYYDFRTAFPSLARAWMLRVLRRIGCRRTFCG